MQKHKKHDFICISLGSWCSSCLSPASQAVCLAVTCPPDRCCHALSALSNLGIRMGSILQVHSTWLVRAVLLIKVFLYYAGYFKWLNIALFLACRQNCIHLDVLPGCLATRLQKDPDLSFQGLAWIEWSSRSLSMGDASQGRKKKKTRKSKPCLGVVQIVCFLLNSDGGLVWIMLEVVLLFVPDKELRPSLFIIFKQIFSL